MKKQIEMSLETARELYRQRKEISHLLEVDELMEALLENFTLDELEDKKGYTWEESFNGEGWLCGYDGPVHRELLTPHIGNKIYYKTKEQAESALAFSQLSHIVARYNQGKTRLQWTYSIVNIVNANVKDSYLGIVTVGDSSREPHLVFYSEEDVDTSLKNNRDLWLKYWMINEH